MTATERQLRLPVMSAVSEARMLVRPLRLADEHAIGHWLRQAHLNGLRDPRWMLDPLAARGAITLRVCPLCLQESNAYWRAIWLEINRPWCAIHRIWLVDKCTACHQTLRWGRTRLVDCECGQSLWEIEVSEISDQVLDALDVVPVPVLLWLGAVARFGLMGKPLKGASSQVVAEMATLIELGAAQTVDWPAVFFLMLDGTRISPVQPGSDRLELLTTALPGLTKRLAKIRDKTWRAKLTEAVGHYVTSSRTGHGPLAWKNAPGCRPPSVAKVARGMGIGAARLAGTLDGLGHSGVSTRRTAGGRFRRLVSAEAAKAAKELLDSRVALKPAARLLGLSVSRLEQLIAIGSLNVSNGMLDRRAVTALRQDLIACAEGGLVPGDVVTLKHALRYWVPVRQTGALLDALLSKEMPCYLSQATTQSGDLMLSVSAVRSWSTQASTATPAFLTIPEASTALGLKQQVVYHLVRMELIDARTEQVRKRNAQVVTQQALRDFKSRFIPLAWAAARAGIDHRNALRWARAAALEIASGPTVDGGRQYFIRIAPDACSQWGGASWGSTPRPHEQGPADAGSGQTSLQTCRWCGIEQESTNG